MTALAALCMFGSAALAAAQDGWKVAVYPVLGWLPLGIEMNVQVPPSRVAVALSRRSAATSSTADSTAPLGGVSAEKGSVRIDADFVWAAVGGDRLDSPVLTVDVDLIYGHGMVGFKVAPDFSSRAACGGWRSSYDITIGDQAPF